MNKIYDQLFYLLVERNPDVYKKYLEYCRSREKNSVFLSGLKALEINFRVLLGIESGNYANKLKYPETENCSIKRESIEALTSRFASYDIISFDIFDTLILRPFQNPEDLFELLGTEFGIGDFKAYRIKAEKLVRKKSNKSNNEINIYDIYKELNAEFGLDIDKSIRKEIDLETKLCFANSYMKEIYELAIKMGKKVILVSDMYLSSEHIHGILTSCGYNDLGEIYISNECEACKSNGTMQHFLNQKFAGKRILHIGDNIVGDIENSKRNGWDTYHYQMVNGINNKYRQFPMSNLVGSVYKSIINSEYYSKNIKHSLYYEYGFTCGGILIWGFCQWLEDYRKLNNIDRFLFLARDGEILLEIYDKYFNNGIGKYLWFSRVASEKLIVEDYFEEYLEQCIKPEFDVDKIEQSIGSLLKFCDLGFLESELMKYIPDMECSRKKIGYNDFRTFMYDRKKQIIEHFEQTQKNAQQYIKEQIGEAKNICAIDSGWRGSSLLYLKHLIEQTYQMQVSVSGVLVFSDKRDYSDAFKTVGIIESYMNAFLNKDLEDIANIKKKRVALECMFSSSATSLIDFGKNKYCSDESSCFTWGKVNKEAEKSIEIQNGIRDFIYAYTRILGEYAYKIKVRSYDAIAPTVNCLKNDKFLNEVLKNSNTTSGFRHGVE